MADIDIKCAGCGKTSTLSEFAEIALIKCKFCGSALSKENRTAPPGTAAADPLKKDDPPPPMQPSSDIPEPAKADEKKKLSLKKQAEPSDEPAQVMTQPAKTSQWSQVSDAKNEVANRHEKHFNHTMASAVIFVILAGVSGGLRYGNFVPSIVDLISVYGPWAVIAMHVTIILKAFKDNLFSGVLCLLVPGYSFYYLFFSGDDFYTRAVFGGILVGIGYDSGLVINEWLQDGIAFVTKLIAQT